MNHVFLLALPIYFLLTNCTPMKSIDQIPDSEKLIYYERTPCFGFCPIYEVTVLPDGQAWYIGDRFVPFMDTIQITIPEKTMTQVQAILHHPDYLNYQLKEPEYQVTDIPGLNFMDFTNDRIFELDQIIPPAIDKITQLIDRVLTEEKLIYDPDIYPMIRNEILVELSPGTDPFSLDGEATFYQLSYLDEIGGGIFKYEMISSTHDIEKALKAVKQRKGVRETQLNHSLERR